MLYLEFECNSALCFHPNEIFLSSRGTQLSHFFLLLLLWVHCDVKFFLFFQDIKSRYKEAHERAAMEITFQRYLISFHFHFTKTLFALLARAFVFSRWSCFTNLRFDGSIVGPVLVVIHRRKRFRKCVIIVFLFGPFSVCSLEVFGIASAGPAWWRSWTWACWRFLRLWFFCTTHWNLAVVFPFYDYFP